MVSSSRFSNNDSVSYWYSSTGSRIQRKVVKAGQPDSYTIYDGEMVYQFTGNVTSLNDFKVSEIQNPEGRFVNGKLEYGYTDHIGNLRLSYKDSLGVAFITQSQSYDPWSNVNAGSEYQLAGIQGDRYLVSGKENDNITGNTLLDWRDYDSVTGRMNSSDPEDQFVNMSGFAYCMNNPVSHVDPSGRIVPLIVIGVGALVGGLGNLGVKAYQGRIGSFGDGLAAFGIGAVAGAAGAFTGGSAFVAAGGSFAVAGAGGFFAGAVGGIAGSSVSSPIQGLGNAAYFKDPYSLGDFGRDVAIGGFLGGVGNGLAAGLKGNNFWSGSPKANGYGTFSFNNAKGLVEQGWNKVGNGKWSYAGGEDLIFSGVDVGNGQWNKFAGKKVGDLFGGLTEYYPKNGGALTKWKSEFLMPGMEIDRFGSGFGKYFSPRGTPLDMRALPSGNNSTYNAFKVVKPFEVQSSIIAPAFGKIGLGVQYLSPVNMNILLRRGVIIPIK